VTVVLTTGTCTCRNLTRTNQIDLITDRASARHVDKWCKETCDPRRIENL